MHLWILFFAPLALSCQAGRVASYDGRDVSPRRFLQRPGKKTPGVNEQWNLRNCPEQLTQPIPIPRGLSVEIASLMLGLTSITRGGSESEREKETSGAKQLLIRSCPALTVIFS